VDRFSNGKPDHERSTQVSNRQIFLAAPFSGRFDKIKNMNDKILKATLQKLIIFFEQKNFEVFSAHREEEWGNIIMPPDKIVTRDLEWVKASEILVAYIDDNCSAGTFIEIGWATVYCNHILVIVKDTVELSPLVLGLDSIPHARLITFSKDNDLLAKLENYLSEINI
jgi:nucleoside 2-deoxyribosyltransferase